MVQGGENHEAQSQGISSGRVGTCPGADAAARRDGAAGRHARAVGAQSQAGGYQGDKRADRRVPHQESRCHSAGRSDRPGIRTSKKILAALNAGTGLPDVGRLSDSGAAANAGYVKPVEQYVDQAWKDEIFDVAWQDCTFTKDGDSGPHIWAIPQMLATEVWFYNKTMFQKAGLDPEKPPQTTDEFAEIARKLTLDTDKDGRIDQWGVDLGSGRRRWPHHGNTSRTPSFGGQLVAGKYVDMQIRRCRHLEFARDDRRLQMAGTRSTRTVRRRPSTISDTVRDVASNFRAGKAAMSMCGPWEMQATADAMPSRKAGWDWELFRIPAGPGGKRGDFTVCRRASACSRRPRRTTRSSAISTSLHLGDRHRALHARSTA